jgi:hypothetical protein
MAWELLGGEFSSGPAVASWSANRLDVFGRGMDFAVWQNSWNGTVWSGWGQISSNRITSDPAAVSRASGLIDLFARGTDNAMYHQAFDGSWSGWTGLGGEFTSSPAAASWEPGRLDIFARGRNLALWHNTWSAGSWSGWGQLTSNTITSDPAAISRASGRIDVFARGTDNAMYHRAFDGAWSGWVSLGGQFMSGPAVASWESDRLDTFGRGMDLGLWQNTWTPSGGWTGWVRVSSGDITSRPAAVSWASGRLDVVARLPNRAMAHTAWEGAWFPLDRGVLVKERSTPQVYGIFNQTRVWIPTPSALYAMGHSWADVRVVPDGYLSAYREVRIPSGSLTPGSLVFPPPNDPKPPWYGRHFAIQGVRGAIEMVSQGRDLSIIELRGWLHNVPPGYVTYEEAEWDDWHYSFELDSHWAAEQGLDLNNILRVGNIIEESLNPAGPDNYRQIATPFITVEINCWKPGNSREQQRPEDWQFPADGSAAGQDFPNITAGDRWPFDPRVPISDDQPPYVRVSGSLITDKDHGGAAIRAWLAGAPNESGDAVSRRTEIHPPDLIEILPYRDRAESLRGVAVVAGTGLFEGAETELDTRIVPQGQRPSAAHGIKVIELIGPETDLSTLVEGNDSRTGAFLQASPYDVRLAVKVRRTGVGGRPGRFKAIYRVFWALDGLKPPQGWWSQSGTLPLDPPDRINYTITPGAVSSDAVEFVLTAGPGITWRKVLTIADGRGGSWDVVTQDTVTTDRNGLYLDQLRDGTLTFWKAVFVGTHRVTTLGDLDQLLPGTRVTFVWVTD